MASQGSPASVSLKAEWFSVSGAALENGVCDIFPKAFHIGRLRRLGFPCAVTKPSSRPPPQGFHPPHSEGEPPANPGRGDIRRVLCRSGEGTTRMAPGDATLSPSRFSVLTLVEPQGSAQALSLTRERNLQSRANMATDSSWHSPVPSSGWAAL